MGAPIGTDGGAEGGGGDGGDGGGGDGEGGKSGRDGESAGAMASGAVARSSAAENLLLLLLLAGPGGSSSPLMMANPCVASRPAPPEMKPRAKTAFATRSTRGEHGGGCGCGGGNSASSSSACTGVMAAAASKGSSSSLVVRFLGLLRPRRAFLSFVSKPTTEGNDCNVGKLTFVASQSCSSS